MAIRHGWAHMGSTAWTKSRSKFNIHFASLCERVFKRERIRQGVFVPVRKGISLEAWKHKPFDTLIFVINKYLKISENI